MWAAFKVSIEFVTVLLLFWFLAKRQVDPWLPDQGWNPHVLHWKGSLNSWTTRKTHSRVFFFFFNKEFIGAFEIAHTHPKLFRDILSIRTFLGFLLLRAPLCFLFWLSESGLTTSRYENGRLSHLMSSHERRGGPSLVSGEGVLLIQHHEADGCPTVVQRCCVGFKTYLS